MKTKNKFDIKVTFTIPIDTIAKQSEIKNVSEFKKFYKEILLAKLGQDANILKFEILENENQGWLVNDEVEFEKFLNNN